MSDGRLPGYALIEIEPNGKERITCNGVADVDCNREVDVETRFPIGCITKQFTAAAVLSFAAATGVDRSERVARHVPEIGLESRLTIGDLLAQRTTLPLVSRHSGDVERALELDGWLRRSRDVAAAPANAFTYNNFNYIVLGALLERAYGLPYGDVMTTLVFGPRRLARSDVLVDWALANVATGYDAAAGVLRPARHWHPSWLGASGGVVSTIADLGTWLRTARAPALDTVREYADGFHLLHGERCALAWHRGQHSGFQAAVAITSTGHRLGVLANVDGYAPHSFDVMHVIARFAAHRCSAALAPSMPEHRLARALVASLAEGRIAEGVVRDEVRARLTEPVLGMMRKALQQFGAVQQLLPVGFSRVGEVETGTFVCIFPSTEVTLRVAFEGGLIRDFNFR
jgi:hypothetical protein